MVVRIIDDNDLERMLGPKGKVNSISSSSAPPQPYFPPVDESEVPPSLAQRREEELALYERRILESQDGD